MLKRVFDFVFSFCFLILLMPLFLLISILIIINSRGPVFYLQSRVGKSNVDFKIFKFRSMYVASDKSSFITIGNRDPRITSVGYYIRKYKLDELPQLINVLLGNMSFVGPRPEVRKYVELYNAEQLKVLTVKPGITDYASIQYSNENEILASSSNPNKEYIEVVMPSKLQLNLKYIKEQSFFTDVKILYLTFLKILRH
ncbi:MAG TPA: sugar transferase [Bacteroidia bacterium]|nr:sugar transferase [Bacteroidia bacterium]HNU34787.1 sugar transferase [Bacteroidia bacterium]